MTAEEFLRAVLDPGIVWCKDVPDWNVPFNDPAELLLLTIAGQESGWQEHVQIGNGVAHGYWQFERAGGVTGVLTNPATKQPAVAACLACGVSPVSPTPVWTRMGLASGDNLAVAFARLLLWSDPAPLPALANEQAAWNYYVRDWRPGAVAGGGDRAVQARDRWHANYQAAMTAVV